MASFTQNCRSRENHLVFGITLITLDAIIFVQKILLAIAQWEKAAEEFGDCVKDHATALPELIRTQEKTNKKW